MALIQAYNPSSGGGGAQAEWTTQNEVVTEAFSEGYAIILTDSGSGILPDTIIVNMMEKILIRGSNYDYTFSAPNIITINFADDPTQYANGQIIFQISYAYNA